MPIITPRDVFYFCAQDGSVRDREQGAPSNFYVYCLPQAFRPKVHEALQRATAKWESTSDYGNYEYTQEFLNECLRLDNQTRRLIK